MTNYLAKQVPCTCCTEQNHWILIKKPEQQPCNEEFYPDSEIDSAIQEINYGKILRKQ